MTAVAAFTSRRAVDLDRITTVEGLAARAFARHRLTPLAAGPSRGDGPAPIKGWRCATPKTGFHAFTVVALPGRLIVAGDGIHLALEREADMVAWARAAVADVDYFAGKVVRQIPTREYAGDCVRGWVAEEDAAFAANVHAAADRLHRIWVAAGLRGRLLRLAEDGTAHEVVREILAAGYTTDPPTFLTWTYDYLWGREAVKWFLAALPAAERY